jgi:hypothetical protein
MMKVKPTLPNKSGRRRLSFRGVVSVNLFGRSRSDRGPLVVGGVGEIEKVVVRKWGKS